MHANEAKFTENKSKLVWIHEQMIKHRRTGSLYAETAF